MFAAAYWKPRAVFAIYSEFSSKFRAVIEQEIGALELGITINGRVVSNIEADPSALYLAIQTALVPYLRSSRENPQIALDVTGGTSVMSVGAAMAITLIGGRLLYIPSDPQPDDPTKRQLGTERCLPFDDPYTVFGDLKADEARRLYKAHDYAGAQRIFAELAAHVPAAHGAHYPILTALSAVYVDWDAFDLPAAHAGLQTLLADLDRANWPALRGGTDQLRFQLEALSCLKSAQERLKASPFAILSTELNTVLALLGSLYSNAMRREAQGRYDVAALLLYRCLELMSQRRLAVRGTDADAKHITLMKGYGQLESACDPLVWSPAAESNPQPRLIDRIRETTTARNKSILAHGFRLIREAEEYRPFRAVVEEVFDRFYTAESIAEHTGRARGQWLAMFDCITLE